MAYCMTNSYDFLNNIPLTPEEIENVMIAYDEFYDEWCRPNLMRYEKYAYKNQDEVNSKWYKSMTIFHRQQK